MDLLSWFKTSEKAIDTAVDLVKEGASGLDMLFFTPEEKSIASAKVMDQVIEMHKANHDENSERSKARRDLAKLLFYNVFAMAWVAIISEAFKAAGWITESLTLSIVKIATAFSIGWAFVAVVIFYFGYYGAQKVMKAKTK